MSAWETPKLSDEALPAPLIEAHIDLRDRRYMPLLVWRLRDSEFRSKATLEEIGGAQLLWEAAWVQVPAGSLPNDDEIIGKILGFAQVRTRFGNIRRRFDKNWNHFQEIKRMCLWNFVLCSDGRFYHPVICEEAKNSWEIKQKQKHRTKAACDARWTPQNRNGLRDVSVTDSVTDYVTDSVTVTKLSKDKDKDPFYQNAAREGPPPSPARGPRSAATPTKGGRKRLVDERELENLERKYRNKPASVSPELLAKLEAK
jgi:hypothetical protein